MVFTHATRVRFPDEEISRLEAMAQLAARRIPDPKVGGSTPSSFIRVFFLGSSLLEVHGNFFSLFFILGRNFPFPCSEQSKYFEFAESEKRQISKILVDFHRT